ncbi:MAG: CPBP family intramembrane metalloprotease, partial [Dehalococcoidales bacterium]|nr:CPBP family intramembrane metalloprotease [Dehalococcoidales bacterium]
GIAGAGLIVLFITIRKNIRIADYLGLKTISPKTFLVLLAVIAGLLAASFGLEQVIDSSEQNFDFMVQTYETAVWLPLLWIAVIIFAPVFEEMFFRGFLLVGLKESRIGAPGAIVLTSITWAALHIQYDAFGLISILVLGIVLGIVRLKTGSLWSTIFLHSLWNTMAMVQTALYVNGVG